MSHAAWPSVVLALRVRADTTGRRFKERTPSPACDDYTSNETALPILAGRCASTPREEGERPSAQKGTALRATTDSRWDLCRTTGARRDGSPPTVLRRLRQTL